MHLTFHTLLFKIYLGGLSKANPIPYQKEWQKMDEKWNNQTVIQNFTDGFHSQLFLSSVLERCQEVGVQKVLFFHSVRICISRVTDGQAHERTLVIPVVQMQ